MIHEITATVTDDYTTSLRSIGEAIDKLAAIKRGLRGRVGTTRSRTKRTVSAVQGPSLAEDSSGLIEGAELVVDGEAGTFKFKGLKNGSVNCWGGPKGNESHRSFKPERVYRVGSPTSKSD